LTDDLLQRLDWSAQRIDLPAGRYETILPAGPVAALVLYGYLSASARDAMEGRSVFSAANGATRIGEALSPHPLRLYSDPSYPGMECSPFSIVEASGWGVFSVFDNGFPTGATDWMSDGKLTNLIANRGYAQRSGIEPRPPIDNLILDGNGTASLADMIASTERGLLLTTLWYIREVDPQTLLLTGLTRDGVYLVENGEVQGAVNNFRFNESPVDLLSRATEVGRTHKAMSREWNDFFRRTAMPPLRIPDFNMSTVSKAL
jgi:predicted Zn-dependent protease